MAATTTNNKNAPSRSTTVNSASQIDFVQQIEKHAPWDAWAQKLVNRKKPVPLRKLLPDGVRDSLLWSVTGQTPSDSVDLVRKLGRLKKDRSSREPADWDSVVTDWLDKTQNANFSVDYALECVAWAQSLSRLAPRVTGKSWWALAANLIDCASDALNSMVLDTKHSDFSLLHIGQLLTCELPLSLAYWFPRIDVFCEMGQRGTAALSESIIELLDGEGVPHARHLPYLPLLFACWTRCVYLDSFGPGNRIDRDARLQFEWLVRQTLRFRRADGQLVLTQCDTPARLISDMISAAMAIAGDDLDRDIQSAALPKSKLPVIHHLPAAGEHSAWAEVAVLRTDWTTSAAICAIDFCRECPSIELAVGKKLIAQGQDMPTVQVNGQMAAVRQPWEEICWESDDDVDYVELEAVLQHGLVLQRQYALFRDEMLLFTADAILGATQTDIEYERRLPFVDGISLSAKEETRELTMELGTTVGRVLPLALPEWRAGHHFGNLASDGILRQSTRGDALYSPLIIDLNAQRSKKQLTWRQLTVAEKLQIVPIDTAVAYRIQIGKEQWLIYRSLGPKANRTFLGQNHTTEFLFGRFTKDGDIETLVEVE